MNEDGVLQQVREAREAYARAHGFDVRAIVADLKEQDARGDWPVVRLAPRRPGAEALGIRPAQAVNAECSGVIAEGIRRDNETLVR